MGGTVGIGWAYKGVYGYGRPGVVTLAPRARRKDLKLCLTDQRNRISRQLAEAAGRIPIRGRDYLSEYRGFAMGHLCPT